MKVEDHIKDGRLDTMTGHVLACPSCQNAANLKMGSRDGRFTFICPRCAAEFDPHTMEVIPPEVSDAEAHYE